MKVSVYFPDPGILAAWDHIKDELDTFDQTVTDLSNGFKAADTSKGHENAIASVDETLDQISEEFKSFFRLMNAFMSHEKL
jgi:hypothetical protein